MGRQFTATEEDEHAWERLIEVEREDLGRVLGADAAEGFGARSLSERVTLRNVRRVMTSDLVAGDLWREVHGVVWVSPNQMGLLVEDAARVYERARGAMRADGELVFRPDPRWLLRFFKHGAEWSLREAGAAQWGLQLYRRGRERGDDGEIVADLDSVPLSAGAFAHIRDVMRPASPASNPLDAWRVLSKRV